MSIAYSNTSAKSGILQRIEEELDLGDGFITGDSTRLAQWTASVNLALDKAYSIIFQADGTWDFDDSNHTTYPILTGNLVSGQRDYSFTADADGNVVLEIDRVFVKTSSTGPYYELFPRNVQNDLEGEISGFIDGQNGQGRPQWYDKTATGIFLDPIPNTSVTAGLKVYVSREGSYFLTSDTTKKPGFAGLFHEYLVIEPAYRYARGHGLAQKETYKRDVKEMEDAMREFYGKRSKDERKVLIGEPVIYE